MVVIVEAAGITRISRGSFNTFVVHDGGAGQPIVVDPGLDSNGRDAVTAAGIDSKPVVVCTHGHSDHVAGVPTVCALTKVGYHLPAVCEDYLAMRRKPGAPGIREVIKIAPTLSSQPFDLAAVREAARSMDEIGHVSDGMLMPAPPEGFLRDGESLTGTSGWEILSTPGHTDDSTSLYHADTATLISGDAVLSHDGKALFNPEILNAQSSEETEHRLRTLPVERLYPGHGLPIVGSDLLATARSFRDKPVGKRPSAFLARLIGHW